MRYGSEGSADGTWLAFLFCLAEKLLKLLSMRRRRVQWGLKRVSVGGGYFKVDEGVTDTVNITGGGH